MPVYKPSSRSIKLGLMPPLTGLVGIYGAEITWAARIACQRINERGGLLGLPLELIVEDDGSYPETAVPAARRLVEEHGCVALIGNLLSNSRIAIAAQVAEPKRIPYLNFSFYEGSISGRYFFHFAALPNQQIDKMIPFMAARYGEKMFFAGNNYEWPRGSIDAAKQSLKLLNGDVLGEEYLPMEADDAQIEALLERVARSGADVFVPYFAGDDQLRLLTRFTEMGLKQRMAVVMGHYDEVMVSYLPPQVREGFYSSNTYFMSVDTPANHAYLKTLGVMPGIHGVWPKGNGFLTNFGEGAFICVNAFAQAVTRAGSLDAEALVDALETVCVEGPQGVVCMDAATHHAQVNSYLSRCRADGTFEIIESFGTIAPQIPVRYQSVARAWQIHASPTSPQLAAHIASKATEALERFGSAQQILSMADIAILATDARGVIIDANPGVCQLFGYELSELQGMSVHLLVPPHFRARHAELFAEFVGGDETARRMSQRGEITGYRKDGTFFPLEASIAKFRSDGQWFLAVTMRDITERKQAEEALLWRATHDALTGLPNRALMRERLNNALLRSQRHNLSLALLFIDLDGFKLINDTHGHEAGDDVLQVVAERLMASVRPGDTVARLAGDEFAILSEQIAQPEDIASLAERINQCLREAISHSTQELFVSASIGVAIGHGDKHTADELLRYADTAMYAVKQKGRDGWQFFNHELQEEALQRLTITQGLRLAVAQNELFALYQPIVTANDGRIIGAELLLRWRSSKGLVSPAVFIPIAEMTGAIVPIGAWVFRAGCEAEVAWRQRWGEQAPYISINISARQLSEPTIVEDFIAILKQTGADPHRISLEVTETSLMADIDGNLRALRRFTELGMRLAVDDFGTGYSSLAQLTRLPASVLKIDRAFIYDLEHHSENRTVVRAVMGLGKALGLRLIAEGVETKAQQQELYTHGCDFIQGYLFYRPLTQEELGKAVDQQAGLCALPKDSPHYFIIYVSRATAQMNPSAFEQILVKARAYNVAAGITGCLIYQEGQFMQMLEGPKDKIHILLDHIRADLRHTDFTTVIEGYSTQRVFPDWSMGFRDMTHLLDAPDFTPWRKRKISLFELAEDARTSYTYITALATCKTT